ncbi:MAG: hypothetical protein IPP53_10560 [Bacteroidetes bacterium]|nr:hypothetical protein [Bacteroidota bacterium]
MKNISVLLFIIALEQAKPLPKLLKKSSWVVVSQYDSTFTKDKLGNNFPSFLVL